jgi:hypothetical protein
MPFLEQQHKNKPMKKINNKIIIPKNNDSTSEILSITDNIIELPCSLELQHLTKNLESSNKIFNFDNDIINWFKLNFQLTENKNDTLKVKDIYEIFTKSSHYENMTKIERKKYNKSYFVHFIETNKFFTKYYCEKNQIMRTFIKCWKIKTDDNNDLDQ